ncbi:MAG TPA: DUF424 domain-containing protein [Methanocorpusculum sp.]|nr:DUF424 domain-containing protein [Methanocorpusculum sp.]
MHLKIHKTLSEGTVVAACDAELIGKTLTGDHCDLVIDEVFYGSEAVSDTELIKALEEAVNANIIGHKVCAVAVKAGIITEETCMKINGIPHAQIYRV